MASHAEDLTDAVVSYLNGLSLSQSFTSTKRLFPRRNKADISALTVDVFPISEEWDKLTRGGTYERVYTVAVAVIKPIDNDNTDIGTNLTLAEEIKENLSNQTLDSKLCIGLDQPELYSYDFVADSGFFVSQINFRFKGIS